MAGITHGQSGATPDELLRLGGSTGIHKQTLTDASVATTAVYYGPDKLCGFRLIVAGAVSATATLDIAVQIASDAAGTGATTVASFPQQSATMATATGQVAAYPRVVIRTTAAKPYVLFSPTVSAGDSFADVSVLYEPVGAAAA